MNKQYAVPGVIQYRDATAPSTFTNRGFVGSDTLETTNMEAVSVQSNEICARLLTAMACLTYEDTSLVRWRGLLAEVMNSTWPICTFAFLDTGGDAACVRV